MTKKDYIIIASAFASVSQKMKEVKNTLSIDNTDAIASIDYGHYWIDKVLQELILSFSKDNQRFDEIRFIDSIGSPKKHYCRDTGAELKHCRECGRA